MSKKKTLISLALVITAIVLVVLSVLFYLDFMSRSLFRRDLKRFSQESYDSVFLSMHSSSGYDPEIFKTYFALNTIVSSYEIQSINELQEYLEKIFSSDNAINHAFLLLDPAMIWDSCGQNNSKWDKTMQTKLFCYISAHPETDFKILLPHPSLEYWLNMDQPSVENTLNIYSKFIEDISAYVNIETFYMGSERWLLVNPDNYVSDFDANDIIEEKTFLTCFSNNLHQITPANAQTFFDDLQNLIIAERTSPTVYPDLSGHCLVFFGDSLMAYGKGTTTTPGYITGFSDAVTYNYAVGGTPVGDFPNAMSRFLSEFCVQKEDGTYQFLPKDTDISDKNLCFFLLYGANDYFSGNAVDNPEDPYDTATYAGVLRSSLKQFMPLFPDAKFIIMTPNYTAYFSYGTEPQSDIGGVLTDYVDAAVSVAEELGVPCMDNYHGLGINESNIGYYTADGCHPNENGRLLMAEHIISFVENMP